MTPPSTDHLDFNSPTYTEDLIEARSIYQVLINVNNTWVDAPNGNYYFKKEVADSHAAYITDRNSGHKVKVKRIVVQSQF